MNIDLCSIQVGVYSTGKAGQSLYFINNINNTIIFNPNCQENFLQAHFDSIGRTTFSIFLFNINIRFLFSCFYIPVFFCPILLCFFILYGVVPSAGGASAQCYCNLFRNKLAFIHSTVARKTFPGSRKAQRDSTREIK